MEIDYKGFCKALGVHIKQLRKERGWSNRDILLIHGIHDGQWRKYERGGGITVESMLRVAATFGMSLGAFLDGLKDYPIVTLPEIAAKKSKKTVSKTIPKPNKNPSVKQS